MKLVRNPDDVARYLACLNTCFPGWGDRATFDWVFRRRVGEHASDLMIIEVDGEWIAGSAVSYRPLVLPNGNTVTAGIMTGSWTLAAARGRGCFTRIIDESIAFVREKHGALLLAFVTVSNASYRRLAAAGAALFPTLYTFSSAETPQVEAASGDAAPVDVTPTPSLVAELEQRASALADGHLHFAYRGDEWAKQLLHRADPTTLVHVPGLGHAVVETHGEFDRLQALLPLDASKRADLVKAMLGRAQGRDKKLFLFVSDAVQGDAIATHCGLGSAEGFLTANIADQGVLEAAMGRPVHCTPERGSASEGVEVDARVLGTPESGSFLGHFALQTGDRM